MSNGSQSSPSTKMPMSPEIAAVIARQGWRAFRPVLYIAAGTAILVFLVGLGLSAGAGGAQAQVAGAFLVVAVVTFAIVAGLAWLLMLFPVRRDLGSAYYLRTTGPVRVEPIPMTFGATLRLADATFQMKGSAGMRELRRINHGTVDHTPYGHVILAAWDLQANEVYRVPGYNVAR